MQKAVERQQKKSKKSLTDLKKYDKVFKLSLETTGQKKEEH